MFPRILAAFLLLCVSATLCQAAEACGGATACRVMGGNYRIELPRDGHAKGVYVFFHGYMSSAELQMKQRKIVETVLAHHLAFAAVDGIDGSWSFLDSPRRDRDEKAFVSTVLSDLRRRYGFMPRNTVLGGFSIGASMAWYAACQQGEKARAMVTFSGVFWDPLPRAPDCVANVPEVVHFHGTADQTFPLAGRAIGAHFHQGDAFKSMAILRDRAGCRMETRRKLTLAGIDCDDVPDCLHGMSLMCVHNGGHKVYPEMLDAGLAAIGFPQ